MELLGIADTGLDAEITRRAALDWMDRFGPRLRGIISADDSMAQLGIDRAVAERGRADLVLVACGATAQGMRRIKERPGSRPSPGSPPTWTAALPIQVAVDWFNGLAVRARYAISRSTSWTRRT